MSRPPDPKTNPFMQFTMTVYPIALVSNGAGTIISSALSNNPADGNALIIVDGNGDFSHPYRST